MARQIIVAPPNPMWPNLFSAEAENLAAIFGSEMVAIHHIGSTAIPHIYAKPIIDILVAVQTIERIDNFNPTMRQAGYIPKGEAGVPGRRFFIKGTEDLRTHHVHIYQQGHLDIARHLNFRDYLIAHPDQAKAYSDLKQSLSQQFAWDIDSYMAGKDGLIKELERQAKAWKIAKYEQNIL